MIFDIHTRRMNLAPDINLDEFVMSKDELSGADIKAVCTEAGLLALRERRMQVTQADFKKAKEKVLYKKTQGVPEGLYLSIFIQYVHRTMHNQYRALYQNQYIANGTSYHQQSPIANATHQPDQQTQDRYKTIIFFYKNSKENILPYRDSNPGLPGTLHSQGSESRIS